MTRKVAMVMAGGTGGHVFPALATARVLQRRGYDIVWLGTRRGIEARLVPAETVFRPFPRMVRELALERGREVDFRLRPSGNAGPLATHVEAFERRLVDPQAVGVEIRADRGLRHGEFPLAGEPGELQRIPDHVIGNRRIVRVREREPAKPAQSCVGTHLARRIEVGPSSRPSMRVPSLRIDLRTMSLSSFFTSLSLPRYSAGSS